MQVRRDIVSNCSDRAQVVRLHPDPVSWQLLTYVYVNVATRQAANLQQFELSPGQYLRQGLQKHSNMPIRRRG